MKTFKGIVLGIVVIVVLVSLMFGLKWLGLEWRGFFGPREQAVEREVFKQSRSYNEAKEQELLKYRLEYMRSDDATEKKAIASTIRMAFADYDETLLSPELRRFLHEIKYGN